MNTNKYVAINTLNGYVVAEAPSVNALRDALSEEYSAGEFEVFHRTGKIHMNPHKTKASYVYGKV